MPKKQTPKTVQARLNGAWLYNAIMDVLEPDLTTANYPKLGKKYAGETEDGTREREARYHRAFDSFETVLNEVNALLAMEAKERMNLARKAVGVKEKRVRTQELEEAEEHISQFLHDA